MALSNRSTKAESIYFCCIIALLIGICRVCQAQTINLKPAPVNVAIDGNAQEWGTRLPYSNDKGKVSYLLSNDRDNIYLVIKTNDTAKQSNILGSGITLSININGNELAPNTTQTITFPERGKEDPSEYMNMDSTQTLVKILLAKYRKIRVKGFATIGDDELSTSNPYGIRIAMGYDDAGYLVYEEVVPLSLFDAHAFDGKEPALNIQINGLERTIRHPTMYAGRKIRLDNQDSDPPNSNTNASSNGVPSHDTVAPISDSDIARGAIRLTSSVDFWVRVVLAKAL